MISLLVSVICLSLGIVLTYASLAKLLTFRVFRETVGNITNFSDLTISLLSIAVIGTELVLGICLIFGWFLLTTLWTNLGMLLVLMGVSRINGKSNPDTLCLCFGQDGVLANSLKSILRSILLLIGTGSGLVFIYVIPGTQLMPISFENIALGLVLLLFLAWVTEIKLKPRLSQ